MIQKLIKSNKKPKSLLVVQSQFSDFDFFIKQYMKSIICDNGGCNQCKWCDKINNSQYFDAYFLDVKVKNIKKEEMINLITKLYSNALESKNIKFLVIKNIDYASKHITNSLLKFVEEPPESTYMIFSTNNINNVIGTIRSRCFSIILPSQINEVDKYLDNYNLSQFQKDIAKQCFNELDELKNNINDFIELFKFYEQLQNNDFFNFISDLFSEFKNFEYKKIKFLIRIVKFANSKDLIKYSEIENNLYLNTNKTLIFNELLNILHKEDF